jgi:hypothetical protein
MALSDIRSVHLPYCIKQQDDGTYVILNREYKPLGFNTRENIKYSAYPICVRLKGLTAKAAAKLSYKNSPDTKEIFLYNDGCIPTASAAHMKAYLARLAHLAKFKIGR